MTKHEFINALRILNSIDRHEVPFLAVGRWGMFRQAPSRFLMQCNDTTADLIWAVIQQRSEPRGQADG